MSITLDQLLDEYRNLPEIMLTDTGLEHITGGEYLKVLGKVFNMAVYPSEYDEWLRSLSDHKVPTRMMTCFILSFYSDLYLGCVVPEQIVLAIGNASKGAIIYPVDHALFNKLKSLFPKSYKDMVSKVSEQIRIKYIREMRLEYKTFALTMLINFNLRNLNLPLISCETIVERGLTQDNFEADLHKALMLWCHSDLFLGLSVKEGEERNRKAKEQEAEFMKLFDTIN